MTRRRYLPDLAAVMHCPPPVVDGLAIGDFTQLIVCIEQQKAALAAAQGR